TARAGPAVRSRTDVSMRNEALCKILCHNVCCLVSAMYELGLDPQFATNPTRSSQGPFMPIDPENPHHHRVAAWLETHCPNFPFPCSACGDEEWMIGDIVACPYLPLTEDGPVVPFVPLFCLRCGYSVFFSARVMGLPPPTALPPVID